MDIHRATWNRQQQILKNALKLADKHPEWLELFLSQHAQVHAAEMSGTGEWSFVDEMLNGLDEPAIRRIPRQGEHSIAWILFHLARIEDVTMNMLVAGREQLAFRESWLDKMGASIVDTGNAMDVGKVRTLSNAINIRALREYRTAVGGNTRQIVSELTPERLNQQVSPERLQQVRSAGAVVEAAGEVLEYWSKKTIAGLLLMPATRHCILHLNEATRIKQNLSK